MRSVIAIVLSLASIGAQASLLGRAPMTPGGSDYQAYYDTVLHITWLADANLPATNTFGVTGICLDTEPVPGSGCPVPPGAMDWDTQQNWIGAMNSASYLGLSNWRLPSADLNGDQIIYTACERLPVRICKDNELSYIYGVMNVTAGTPSPFTNIANYVGFGYYGSSTDKPGEPDSRWIINMGVILSGFNPKTAPTFTWAVSPGDLLLVPIPAAAWLFSGALGLLGVMRRRSTA